MNPHFIPKKCPEKRSCAALPYERGAFSWQDMRFYGAVQPSRHAFYHGIAGFLLCTFGAVSMVRPIFPGNNFLIFTIGCVIIVASSLNGFLQSIKLTCMICIATTFACVFMNFRLLRQLWLIRKELVEIHEKRDNVLGLWLTWGAVMVGIFEVLLGLSCLSSFLSYYEMVEKAGASYDLRILAKVYPDVYRDDISNASSLSPLPKRKSLRGCSPRKTHRNKRAHSVLSKKPYALSDVGDAGYAEDILQDIENEQGGGGVDDINGMDFNAVQQLDDEVDIVMNEINMNESNNSAFGWTCDEECEFHDRFF